VAPLALQVFVSFRVAKFQESSVAHMREKHLLFGVMEGGVIEIRKTPIRM
jgi:hypothetical protein